VGSELLDQSLDQRSVNVIRGLAMDGPQAANSGHPGTAMALAPLAHVLWTRIMRYDPQAPGWPARDRFVLSAGHASILLYAMLELTGYDLSLDDLRDFRQWGSRTPGHPEVHHTEGVEVTTGPLGQGVANAVGMAMAAASLRADHPSLFDQRVFALAGDGDLMEGISHEAASLAGAMGLDHLVVIYDDNHITIDGPTELALDDDAPARFAAYGWHVEALGEIANDLDALEAALRRAMAVEGKPVLLSLRSHIGYPSPKFTDSPAAHGSPFGPDEIAVTKELMGLPADQSFFVPDDVADHLAQAGARHRAVRLEWQAAFDSATAADPTLRVRLAGGGVEGWADALPRWDVGESVATRNASGACLNAAAAGVPGLLAGSADLTGNTGTLLDDAGEPFSGHHPGGRQIHFGVREHAMAAAMNGMALHGGVLPVGGTFFVFSDYMRPALRLAAISEAHVIHSLTHDSVGVGEDGPTHQPVEQLMSLRAMPGLRCIRPADANETAGAWRVAVERGGPTALILSRQNLPVLDGTADHACVARGGYVLRDPEGAPDVVLIGTGSEVVVALAAADQLSADGIAARVVSLPCWELFEEQSEDYRRSVLDHSAPRVSVEAGVTFGWGRYAHASVGIDRFGASAPGHQALDLLGINPAAVVATARALLP
jgi:transketolase